MHATWKPWPHCGSSRISSPEANSVRQMAHSVNLEVQSAVYVSFGRERRTFFFRPLFGGCGGGRGGVVVVAAAVRRRSQTQRAMTTRPRTQTRAQKRARRTKAESEPVVAEDEGSSSGPENSEEDLKPLNNLKGRVMSRDGVC